jgi:YgiT-type zinc finger domain-containing protein
MGRELQNAKKKVIVCRVCGEKMKHLVTDIPFKQASSIVVFRLLPVWQCGACGEYLLEDRVMANVEEVLARAGQSSELEVIRYAA